MIVELLGQPDVVQDSGHVEKFRVEASPFLKRRKVTALALIIAKPPHVFLLDEPTNLLSLTLAGELEDALGTYPGAVVIASHDRWLRCRWDADELHLVGGRVPQLTG